MAAGPAARVRLIELTDADVLAELYATNREFLAPWEPRRDASFATPEGQSIAVRGLLHFYEQGSCWPGVILTDDDAIAGRISLNNIARGAGQYASLGYWVAESHNGRGLATQAVAAMLDIAWSLGLHRVEAGTLVENQASQRVLTANGFTRFGLAPAYLRIDDRWQDHILFQVLNPADAQVSRA
ncbi:GNAT family N-acetyltransferase [Ammonicoccus fulvus]|uniref:GNAT family N-acetyltransferase n=1 Tax=Ammonicoccus fulvus TaxID=3138240 RepID=A0ABZ3FQV5_9ACTN